MQGIEILIGNVLIFGTSGFAREVRDIVHALGGSAGFIARDDIERENSGLDGVIIEPEIEKYKGYQFAIGIGENKVRRKIAEKYNAKLQFPNLIHPSATFGFQQRELINKCMGVIICAGCRFTNNILVGDFSIFNLNSTVGHDVCIEQYVNVAPGANLSGNICVRSGAWIGTNAAINQGTQSKKLEIGENTIIGSGSVVIKDCDPESTYIGIPAKKLL